VSERNPRAMRLELRLVNGWGEGHGAVGYGLPQEAAYMGDRIADDVRAGASLGTMSMSDVVKVMKVREFRRGLLISACQQAGAQLADFLQDREGWHGLDRQERTEEIIKDEMWRR